MKRNYQCPMAELSVLQNADILTESVTIGGFGSIAPIGWDDLSDC